ncbi:MAG: M1 family peptidase [Chryseobacterium sp.]|nr:MAG: M1 family peptidase [Chryseobacterium sp.]
MNRIALILLVFAAGLFSAQKGPYYQQHAKYKMDIDVDAEAFTYQGKQSISYTNNSPDELRVVYMHLYWNAFKPGSMMDQRVQNQGKLADGRLVEKQGDQVVSRLASIPKNEEGAQNIHWIKQNGKTLRYEIQETVMKVYLAEPIKPNSTTNFTMQWDAVIPKQIRRAGRNNREGIDMTMTQWFPKMAEYDYDGWATFDYIGREFHAPFADFDISIKIDKDYVIGAGGTLENPAEVRGYQTDAVVKADKDGKAIWRWTAKNILDFAWAADRDYTVKSFTVLGGPKVYLVYQPGEKTALWENVQPYVTQFFQFMNATFGQYVWPSYSFVQGGDGGMEYGMTTMVLGEHKTMEDLASLFFHEAAHSWYQQMLATNEPMRPWMDEGFTSYAQDLAMYKIFPPKESLPNPFAKEVRRFTEFQKTGREEPASWLGDHHDWGTAYSFATYVKGETFLIQLGYIMGEDNLSKTMKAYYDEWKMKHPTDRDFMHIAQRISGMDLKWFHNYWINTTKTIDYGIKSVKHDRNATTITLVNKGELPMPVDFSILTKDNKVVNYSIPLNMMRTPKTSDIYGPVTVLDYWPWTQKEYTFTIPYSKAQIAALGIDFSQRLADINPADNYLEIK